MINDKIIISEFFTENNKKINSNKVQNKWLNNHQDYKLYLERRYSDIPTNLFSYKEVLWRILNNIDIRPVCECCGDSVNFIGKRDKRWNNGYFHFCENCRNSERGKNIIKEKRENTNLKIYGYKNGLSNKDVRQKIEKTNIEKTGKDNPFKLKNIQEEIVKKRYDKTGFKYPLQNPEILKKQQDTLKQLYGKPFFAQTDSFKNLFKNPEYLKDFLKKKEETLTKNKTHNKSKKEELLKIYLTELYPDLLYQYNSEKYPFNCDFYIPSLDLYIEYNGAQYHNGCLYNLARDKIQLELLKNKEQLLKNKKNQYTNIIETWTIRDIKKYYTAIENKINYLIIYPYWHENWDKVCRQFIKYGHVDNELKQEILNELKNICSDFTDKTNLQKIVGEKYE